MSVVTIIIPTYNSESTINYALDSILGQQFINLDVLVIDALSNDATVTIVSSYARKDKRIKYISERDNGIYDAMNKGIKLATGTWLYFLGSDDRLFDEHMLERIFLLPTLEDCNVLYGNVQINGDNSWSSGAMVYDGPFDFQKLLQKNICHQGIFYRHSFITGHIGLYNLKYKICADWDFNLRCWAKTNFLYTDAIIAFFTGGGASSNGGTDAAFSKDFIKNVLSYFKLSAFNDVLAGCKISYGTEMAAFQKNENYLKYIMLRVSKKLLKN